MIVSAAGAADMANPAAKRRSERAVVVPKRTARDRPGVGVAGGCWGVEATEGFEEVDCVLLPNGVRSLFISSVRGLEYPRVVRSRAKIFFPPPE